MAFFSDEDGNYLKQWRKFGKRGGGQNALKKSCNFYDYA